MSEDKDTVTSQEVVNEECGVKRKSPDESGPVHKLPRQQEQPSKTEGTI